MFFTGIKRYFGQDSLDWFHRSYFLDWFFVGLLWFLSYLASFWPVFERDFSLEDSLISHPHKQSQIGSALNFGIALYIPLLFLSIVGIKKRSFVSIHHGTLALLAGRGLARLITEYLKHRVGRLRPDFLARCKWDEVAKHCAGNKSAIEDGRKSFPSGHSSTAFAGMVFLTLWIAGQTTVLCPSVTPSVKWLPTRMGTFILTLLPLFWAVHVAVTRVEDYRHHKEDVIVGSLIGILSATVCYLLFWPSPFTSSGTTEPRDLYGTRPQLRRTYELTEVDDDNAINTV
ncbi:lipid phosphate phosphatase 1 [Macrolepiota fuliginosa MF-IS2]|uniref:Lipid phosphate phosphatase 1 n=1 Tax=Macrolepiota fuliginosa MF-IS2 TaxID=1400762 RepID=A0A9P6CAM8_9AGAR|nr:lipid phosphate phosphatase 1 [Macrolepiota fuliginosa MF-IS2]